MIPKEVTGALEELSRGHASNCKQWSSFPPDTDTFLKIIMNYLETSDKYIQQLEQDAADDYRLRR